jgi:hypothetical protein
VLTEVLEEISQVMPDIERTYTDIKGEYDPVVEEYTQNALALALEKGNKLREMGVMNKGQYLLYLATKDDVGLIEDIKKGLYNKYDKMAKAKNYPEGITSFKNIIEDFLYNTVFEVYESYPYEINDEFSKEMENELRDYADMRYNMVFDVVMKMVNGSHNPFIEDLSDKQYENLAYMLLDGIINKKKKNKIVMGLGGTDDKDIMPRLLAYPEMAYLLMDAVEEVNEDYKYKYHEIDLDLVPQISQFELNIKNAYELSSKVNKLDSEKAKYNAEKMTLLLAMQAKKRGYADNVVFHAVDVSEIEKSEAFQTAKAGLWEVLKLCYLEYDYRSENEKTDLEMTMKFYKELAAYYPKKYMKGKHINLDAIDFDLAKEISVLQQRAKHHGEGISDEEALCRVIEYVAAHPVIFEDIKDNLNENSFEIGGHGENAFRFMQNAIVSMLKANEYDLNMGNQYKGKNVLGHLSTKAGGKPTPYYNARNYSGYPDDENKQDFYLYELKEGISQFGNEKVEKYIIKSMKPDKERPSPVEDLQLLAKSKGYGGGSTKKQMKLRSVLDLVNDISFNIEYMDKLRLYVDFDLLNIKVQTANEVLDLVGHKANIYGNNEEIISGDTLSQDVVNHAREVDEREGQYE